MAAELIAPLSIPRGDDADEGPADGDVSCPSSKPLESELDGELAPLMTTAPLAVDEMPFTSILTLFKTPFFGA